MPICKKCSSKFPCNKKINGKVRNLSNRSYCLDCSKFGAHNTKKLIEKTTTDSRVCSTCDKVKPNSDFYKRTDRDGFGYRCKQCSNNKSKIDQSRRGASRKIELINHLGGCCCKCGYSRNTSALVFHHIDPTIKVFGLTVANLRTYTWNTCLEEAKKCALLCANCHMELHNPSSNR